MQTTCPSAADLLAAALRDPNESTGLSHHLRSCETCGQEVLGLRRSALALHLNDIRQGSPPQPCPSDEDIAALVEGDSLAVGELATHALSCPECRLRLATVSSLLRDDSVRAEIERLDRAPAPVRRLVGLAAVGAGLAAAVVAGVYMAPQRDAAGGVPSTTQGAAHRERAITTTLAPRLLPPSADEAGIIRWTSVPYADRYQLRVFDRSGALV